MHLSQVKKGRPKLDRPRQDYGTPEAQLKRIAAVGGSPLAAAYLGDGTVVRYVETTGRDPALATCPLDALLARGIITSEAHAAAGYFVTLRKMVFGKASPQAVDLLKTSGGPPNELDLPDGENRYREACTAIKRQGGETFKVTERVLVHEDWPGWIKIPRSTQWERRLLLLGIAALLGWYRGDRRERP